MEIQKKDLENLIDGIYDRLKEHRQILNSLIECSKRNEEVQPIDPKIVLTCYKNLILFNSLLDLYNKRFHDSNLIEIQRYSESLVSKIEEEVYSIFKIFLEGD